MRSRHSRQPSTGRNRRRRNRQYVAPVLLAAFVVLVSACAADESAARAESSAVSPPAASAAGAAVEPPPPEPAAAASPAEAAPPAASSLGAPTALTPADIGRDVVYRATIALEADDVAGAAREAVSIVQGLGGIVFAQTTHTEPEPLAEITFKVLPADFATALERLAGVGDLVDQSISADDVTERIVDLESRIITAEASVARLRKFLEDAVSLNDVATLERELLDRETTLETLRGQLRILRNQVDLATITLTINQSPDVAPEAAMVVSASVSDNPNDGCLGNQHVTVEPDATVYFCLEVENVGASTLTDVEIRPENLGLDVRSFRAQQGSLRRIEPGDLLVATLSEPVVEGRLAGRLATRMLEIGLTVEAVPVDADGAVLPEVSGSDWLSVHVVEERSWPGFVDAVVGGFGALRAVVGVFLIVFGVLVPFLPVIGAAIALIWWYRRRRKGTTAPPERP